MLSGQKHRAPKSIRIDRMFVSFAGIGIVGTNVLLCHYHDMSISLCNSNNGHVLWQSNKDEVGGFYRMVTSLLSSSQPGSAMAISVQGVDCVAVSYPHLYQIKLFKSHQGHWHPELKEHAVAFTSDKVKPDQMCCAGENEMVFLEYSGPCVQMGFSDQQLCILNTSTLPFQLVRTVTPPVKVESFCVLPSPAFNRLFYCVSRNNLVAIDMYGNQFWSVDNLKAKYVCADTRGHLYVTTAAESAVALHVLWHDGTRLQFFNRANLNLTELVPRTHLKQVGFDHKRNCLVLVDGQQGVCLAEIEYNSM